MGDSVEIAPVSLAREPAFTLGRLEVRPASREVIAPDFREILEPRVMQVLVALARSAGRVVSREELTQACWEGRVVGEDAINRVISRLRRLAEHDAGRSFSLETITKVGYRLVVTGPASAEPPEPAEPVMAAPTPPGPAPSDPTARTRWPHRWVVAGIASLVLAIAGAMLLLWQPWQSETARQPSAVVAYEQAGAALDRSTAEDSARAVVLLQEAVELEPDWADAWAQLAVAYLMTLEFNTPEAQTGIVARARAAASRALELEPGHPVGEYVLVVLDPTIRPWHEIEAAQLALLERSPDSRPFIALRLGFLSATGRLKESLEYGKSRGLMPDGPRGLGTYAAVLASSGRLEEADRVLDDAAARYPRNRSVFFQRFWISIFSGRAERALSLVEDLAARPTGTDPMDFALYRATAKGFLTHAEPDIDDAMRRNRAVARKGRGYAQNAMRVAAGLGYLDYAFELAEAIFFDRGGAIGPLMFSEAQGQYTSRNSRPVYLLYDLGTKAMRHDMRFVGIAEGLGLADYWRESGNWPDFCTDEAEAAEVCAALKRGK